MQFQKLIFLNPSWKIRLKDKISLEKLWVYCGFYGEREAAPRLQSAIILIHFYATPQ